MLSRCYFVMLIAPSTHQAYNLFRSINRVGQPLTELDIARGEFLQPYLRNDVIAMNLAKSWDEIQDELGEEKFTIYLKTIISITERSDESRDFIDSFRRMIKHPPIMHTFQQTLKNFIEHYGPLEQATLAFGDGSAQINRIVSCLKALPFSEWKMAALMWLSQRPSGRESLKFFKALDALSLGLLILGATQRKIGSRFHSLVRSITNGSVLDSSESALFLTDSEKEKIQSRLMGPLPIGRRFLHYPLLRLNAEKISKEIPVYFPQRVTIEHILPQNPREDSIWHHDFPDRVRRKELSQYLGNLAILTAPVNARASNFDFSTKKRIYFSAEEANTFPLTAELNAYNDWREDEILTRRDKLYETAWSILNN
jgi:hypothetical protein